LAEAGTKTSQPLSKDGKAGVFCGLHFAVPACALFAKAQTASYQLHKEASAPASKIFFLI